MLSTFWSCHSSSRSAFPFGRSAGQTTTALLTVFVTTTRPRLSRIGPRGASSENVRTWFVSASLRYLFAASTWSDQRRRNRTPNTTSATPPRLETRKAVFGVKRNRSSTRGSGGRKGGRRGPRGGASQAPALPPSEQRVGAGAAGVA